MLARVSLEDLQLQDTDAKDRKFKNRLLNADLAFGLKDATSAAPRI
jgi:hypothetical protein